RRCTCRRRRCRRRGCRRGRRRGCRRGRRRCDRRRLRLSLPTSFPRPLSAPFAAEAKTGHEKIERKAHGAAQDELAQVFGGVVRSFHPITSFMIGSIFFQISSHVTRPKRPPLPAVTINLSTRVCGFHAARSRTSYLCVSMFHGLVPVTVIPSV